MEYTTFKGKNLYKIYYYKEELWQLGQEKIKSPFGHYIKVYDKERTICDCVNTLEEIGRDIVLKAVKEYIESTKGRSLGVLYKYADKLKVKEKARTYVEAFY